MKSEITFQCYTLEKLIESYAELVKHITSPTVREYFTGRLSAFEDLLILFRDDRTLTDINSESFIPSDES